MIPAAPRRRRARRAFALVEAVVATIMLGVGLASIVGLISSALASQRSGTQLEVAAMLADEQLGLVVAAGPDNYKRIFSAQGMCEAPYEDFTYSVDIDKRSGGDPAIITCTISWKAGQRDRSLIVETLLAPRLGDDPDPDRRPETTVERNPSS